MTPSIKVEKSTTTPNFLDSPVGQVLKSRQIPQAMGVVDGSYKTVFAGTPFPANDNTAIGLVYADTDVTDGDAIGTVMVAGRVLKDRVEISDAAVAAMSARGMQFIDEDGNVIVTSAGSAGGGVLEGETIVDVVGDGDGSTPGSTPGSGV